MPRIAKELGPLAVKGLVDAGLHPVGGVAGLMLQVSKSGTRSCLLRVKVGAKRREIGLGAYPGVGVADARKKAQATRDEIAKGIDPVAQRAAARHVIIGQQAAETAMAWTFRKCAEAYIKARAPGWRNAKHSDQWKNTLETYAYPTIGDLMVRSINIEHVINIVEPHWATKNETISRVRNRIELVLDWATVRGYRDQKNPARWKGNLDKLLADRKVSARVVAHRSLAADALNGFMQQLRGVAGTGPRCLQFVVLTACRSGEARLATWGEIDVKNKTWSIPGDRMKSGRPHRVPLSDDAIKLLEALPRLEGTELVFLRREKGQAAVRYDGDGDDAAHGRGCRAAWIPVELFELVRVIDRVPVRGSRDGAGAYRWGSDRGRVSAQRPVRQAAQPDGGLGGVFAHRASGRRQRGVRPKTWTG